MTAPVYVDRADNPFVEAPAKWAGHDGDAWEFAFANGYGASVVRRTGSYGYDSGLWELAVLVDGRITYSTPITSAVIGWLDEVATAALLLRIAELPAAVSRG